MIRADDKYEARRFVRGLHVIGVGATQAEADNVADRIAENVRTNNPECWERMLGPDDEEGYVVKIDRRKRLVWLATPDENASQDYESGCKRSPLPFSAVRYG